MKLLKNFLYLFLQKYQEGLEEGMKGSEIVFDNVDLLYYKYHKINLNRSGPYIDSQEWLKNKQPTVNPKTRDGKCFQYAITLF